MTSIVIPADSTGQINISAWIRSIRFQGCCLANADDGPGDRRFIKGKC